MNGVAETPRRWRHALQAALVPLLITAAGTAYADAPGRGLTGEFEQHYLKEIIDHHYSALRMTELAAGTDTTRDATVVDPTEGTSPTPGNAATPAKAQLENIKSLARRNNRMQREEIAMAQGFLRDWYGTQHEPALSATSRHQIQALERAAPGADFDHRFLETLSRHHYVATTMSNECLAASELMHHELQRYCSGIVHAQLADIAEMRETLCRRFQICDYQPLRGMTGRHSGSEAERRGASED